MCMHTQAAPVLYLTDKYPHALLLSSVVENINEVRWTKINQGLSSVLHLHTCINMHMNKWTIVTPQFCNVPFGVLTLLM